jgi:N-acetylmuramoyl-L-alanine amidase
MSFWKYPALLLCLAATIPAAHPGSSGRIQDIHYWSFGDVTRIVIQTKGEYRLSSDEIGSPPKIYFDLSGVEPIHRGIQRTVINDKRISEMHVAQVSPGRTRVVFYLKGPSEVTSSRLVNPDRLVIEIRPKGTELTALSRVHEPTATTTAPAPMPPVRVPETASVPPLETTPAKTTPAAPFISAVAPPPQPVPTPTVVPPPAVTKSSVDIPSPAKTDSADSRSLVRIFGLKMGKVVIDAGHGGHDTGTIGPNGLLEKDLVLDVALRLGKLINQRLGSTVVYTRADDTFIPLEQRTKIANEEKADLFISIHANSSPEPSATGVETYFFNLTSDKSGLDLATRENAASASAISDLSELLHKAVLQTKKEESREFAQDVQTALWAESLRMNSKSRDRGVRAAPFVVLIGAGMPSILAEVGFVSNAHDEKILKRGDERQRIAEALYKGIARYANSLSHVQVAKAE